MTSREQTAAELERARKALRTIGLLVWGVAVFVMVYGIPIVYDLLTKHGIPGGIAWMLSIAADGALCVGLVATPVLANYGVKAGWVGTLRWVAGLITWALQTAGPFTADNGVDWLGVGTHSAGPILLFFVVEAASHFQRRMGEVVARLRSDLDRQEQADAERRQQRADMAEQLRKISAEHTAVLSRAEHLAQQIETLTAERDTERQSAAEAVQAAEREVERVRSELTERLNQQRAQHAEQIAGYRAQLSGKVVAIRGGAAANGRASSKNTARKAAPANRMSDDDALAAMFAAHPERDYEWTDREVNRITGAGFSSRAPRLTGMASEHLASCRESRHDRCYGAGRSDVSDDAEERAS